VTSPVGKRPMQRSGDLLCCRTSWQGRQAYVLGNDLVRLVTLTGGGHIAEFCFLESSGVSTLNPLWVPPWRTMEPYRYQEELHARRYGAPITGKLISGLVGHNLCLDYFGPPSDEEVKQGLSIHGEAPSAKWQKSGAKATSKDAALELSVRLPIAGLRFSREIKIRRGESVVYFNETVTNERKTDHFFHWTQHVTLGPPFLDPQQSYVAVSATKGRTYPHGYENKALLESSRDFRWPNAPGIEGGFVDLTRPFTRPGLGFVATVLLDRRRDVEFIAALNTRHSLLLAYCFSRRDYPWAAIWEENQARTDVPWSSRCQARGLEFGSTPFPVLRREAFASGPLFGTPHFSVVPARGRASAHYISFLARVPDKFGGVRDIRLVEGEIQVSGTGAKGILRVPASGLRETGLA
jgi:hypothetical protein